MNELEYEKVVCSFLSGALGYENLTVNVWPSDQLLHFPSYLNFIKSSQPKEWEAFCLSENSVLEAEQELKKYIQEYLIKVAKNSIISAHNRLKIKKAVFKIFDEDPKNNIYQYSRQTSIQFKKAANVVQIPDILILINGIPLSLIELKFEPSGQTAAGKGIAQLLNNYRSLSGKDTSFYDRLAHVITMDTSQLYVCRALEKTIKATSLDDIKKSFECYSAELKDSPYVHERGETLVQYSLRMLLSKESLKQELGILNRRIGLRPASEIRIPRMCQKIAVEIALNALRKAISEQHITPSTSNNIFQFLLELATGAGKSEIIAVVAGVVARWNYFDKIVIVTDRIDLKNQIKEPLDAISNVVRTSPIDMPRSVKELQESIKNDKIKTILTTIQSLGKEVNPSKFKSNKSYKTLIIIDEAHRSHKGENHVAMIKNLTGAFHPNSFTCLLGLTATPQAELLDRFQLLYRYGFDKAVCDGLILSPASSMYDCVILPSEKLTVDEAKSIYLESDRITKVNTHILDTIKFQLSQNIKTKAMLCCDSQMAANKQYDSLITLLAEDTSLKKIPVYLLHTHSSLNSRRYPTPQDTLINEFKELEEGIIVVVDKLQTGYDDPKLNTLFLNKYISGVSAIQTVNRVTRKYPGKNSCLIISYADQGGIQAIKEAFEENQYALKTAVLKHPAITEPELQSLRSTIFSYEFVQHFKDNPLPEYSLLTPDTAEDLKSLISEYLELTARFVLTSNYQATSLWDSTERKALNYVLNAISAYLEDDSILLEYIDLSKGVNFDIQGLFGISTSTSSAMPELSADTNTDIDTILKTDPSMTDEELEKLTEWHSYNFQEGIVEVRNEYFNMIYAVIGIYNPTLLNTIVEFNFKEEFTVENTILAEVANIELKVKELFRNSSLKSRAYVEKMGDYYISGSTLLFNEFLKSIKQKN